MFAGGVDRMITVGLIWGLTNALMRRGALIWDLKLLTSSPRRQGLAGAVTRWVALLLTWQYSVPLAVNLAASAAFFHLLGGAPISLAVPVTNAVTFAATAAAAAALGEETKIGSAVVGTGLIVLGVAVCVTAS